MRTAHERHPPGTRETTAMLLGPLTQRVRNIHLIGIGGAGMSGIAEILLNLGFSITGSDMRPSDVTRHLERLGARIFEGHEAAHVKECDVVVYSSAVKEDNVEIVAARARKIPVIKRPEMLAELMRMKYGICIGGTHGKTTTSSMTGLVLTRGEIDPTIIVGGKVADYGGGAKIGRSHFLVLEADEYDRTFLNLTPVIAVVTNIDVDHLDCYRDLDDIRGAFLQFVNKVPFFGSVIVCIDDAGVQSIMPGIERRTITYGISRQAQIRAENIVQSGVFTTFDVFEDGVLLGSVELSVPGVHNVCNALAAVSVGIEMGVPFETIAGALADFRAVSRRFEKKGEAGGVAVYDDYAHHPTEIIAALEGVRSGFPNRIVAVFQPHLYSRTRDFHEDFGRAFMDSDELFVTDIFPAREKPIEGVTGRLVADAALAAGHGNVHYIEDRDALAPAVAESVKPGDVVITIGAGDIHTVGVEILKILAGE